MGALARRLAEYVGSYGSMDARDLLGVPCGGRRGRRPGARGRRTRARSYYRGEGNIATNATVLRRDKLSPGARRRSRARVGARLSARPHGAPEARARLPRLGKSATGSPIRRRRRRGGRGGRLHLQRLSLLRAFLRSRRNARRATRRRMRAYSPSHDSNAADAKRRRRRNDRAAQQTPPPRRLVEVQNPRQQRAATKATTRRERPSPRVLARVREFGLAFASGKAEVQPRRCLRARAQLRFERGTRGGRATARRAIVSGCK